MKIGNENFFPVYSQTRWQRKVLAQNVKHKLGAETVPRGKVSEICRDRIYREDREDGQSDPMGRWRRHSSSSRLLGTIATSRRHPLEGMRLWDGHSRMETPRG